jgi:hypothetical protein
MTNQMLLDLSTRLVTDLRAWSEEATARDAISPEQLEALQAAAEIVDRVTVTAVAQRAE